MTLQHTGHLTAQPLPDAPFGVSVELDAIPDPADLEAVEQLRMLLATHGLVVVQRELSEEEHVQLVSCFGRVLPQGPRVVVNDRPKGPFPIVSFVSNDSTKGGLGTFELAFHHDLGHVPTPLHGISLYGFDVADGQSATRFSSGRLAYQALPAELQQRLDGLQSLFTANYSTTTDRPESARDVRDHLDPTWPRAVHPVAPPHPLTGERSLFVNEMMTVSILGLPLDESDALLDTLFASVYDPAHMYDHQWHNGDLVVWDNMIVQHARSQVGADLPRTLRRVVFGEKVPWEEWPNQVGSGAS